MYYILHVVMFGFILLCTLITTELLSSAWWLWHCTWSGQVSTPPGCTSSPLSRLGRSPGGWGPGSGPWTAQTGSVKHSIYPCNECIKNKWQFHEIFLYLCAVGYGTVVYLVSVFFFKILQYWRNKCPRSYASYYEL